MRLVTSVPSIEVRGRQYPVFLTFRDGDTTWHIIHEVDRYSVVEIQKDKDPCFVHKITPSVLQILQGLPSPAEAIKMPLWLISSRYTALQACRYDAPVRAVFGAYVALLGQLSRLAGETQESQVLRACLDILWPSLSDSEVQQANNIRSILWFSPPK